MADEGKDVRGTIWDWPALVAIMGLLLAIYAGSKQSGGGVLLGLVLAAFGTVTVLARRGSFSPNRR
jgi:hypothetical protein